MLPRRQIEFKQGAEWVSGRLSFCNVRCLAGGLGGPVSSWRAAPPRARVRRHPEGCDTAPGRRSAWRRPIGL